MKRWVRSRHVHAFPYGEGFQLVTHAVRDLRLRVRYDASAVLALFATPRTLDSIGLEEIARAGLPSDPRAILDELAGRGFLHDAALGPEDDVLAAELARGSTTVAEATLSQSLRPRRSPRYQVAVAHAGRPRPATRHRWRAVMMGYCEVQLSLDVLMELAADRGIALDARATGFDDVALVAETTPDFVVVGHMNDVRNTFFDFPQFGTQMSVERYVERMRGVIERIRAISEAPILIVNLPVPTCTPLGLADRNAHRNKARAINLALDTLADERRATWVVDLEAALALVGKLGLLDDSVLAFEHLGPLRFLDHAEAMDRETVWNALPPLAQLDLAFGERGDHEFERLIAHEYLHAMQVIAGVDRKKCVVVDLDGTLWPGVIAETGSPFPLDRDLAPFSLQGLYLGLHQALLALRARGIMLACISKNDPEVVRAAWRFPDTHYPEKVLRLEHFAAVRIGWGEKAEALRSIAEELGIALDACVFVDDSPREREAIRAAHPEVRVLGDNPYVIRWELLTAPELQVPTITDEARTRIAAPRGHDVRMSEPEFLASLDVRCRVQVAGHADLERLYELCIRTNQFNTTTIRYSRQELVHRIAAEGVYAMRVADRLIDYGLVGMLVIEGNRIELVAMSCRVIGLGVERALVRVALADLARSHDVAIGRFVASDRNSPARRLFPDLGFQDRGDTTWSFALEGALPEVPAYVTLEL